MLARLALLPLLGLAGCTIPTDCPSVYAGGEWVAHRITGQKGVVLKPNSRYSNWEGMCLVTVRTEDGDVANYVIHETELAK